MFLEKIKIKNRIFFSCFIPRKSYENLSLKFIMNVMNSDLYFDGATYISAKRAAKISGYVNDYIGQLCRDGKLQAKMVGRSWYVSLESLIAHKNAFVSGTKSKPTFFYKNISILPPLPQFEITHQKASQGLTPSLQKEEVVHVPLLLLSAPKEQYTPVSPVEVSSSQAFHPFQIQFSKAVAFVFAMILSISGFHSLLSLQPETANKYSASLHEVEHTLVNSLDHVHMQLSANVFSSVKDNAEVLARHVYRTTFSLWTQTKYAVVVAIRGDQEVEKEEVPVVAALPKKGIVVIPTEKVSDQEKTIADIKNTFSDEISIEQKDDSSGVITPVFKDTKGDDYLYVLVPISN